MSIVNEYKDKAKKFRRLHFKIKTQQRSEIVVQTLSHTMLRNTMVTNEGTADPVQATATDSVHKSGHKPHRRHQYDYSTETSQIIHFSAFFSFPFHFVQSQAYSTEEEIKHNYLFMALKWLNRNSHTLKNEA